MTSKTVKLIVFIVLIIHGIGHIQGVVSSLGIKFHGTTTNVSWLLKSLGAGANRTICLALYLAAAILGILTALGLKGIIIPFISWQVLALLTAIVSSACLILFPNALAMFFNKAGAIAVNLIIFYSILFNGNWPSVIFED